MESLSDRFDPSAALARIEHAFAHLRDHFFGRDHVLEQILYALLTREHALIIGDRGLAKSRLARSVFAQFQAPNPPFSLQLTRSTSVGQLVGGLDLVAFERGEYLHHLDGYIVRAEFAFLDELFDANDFVLRALNGILNEREFLNGPQVEHAALHSAIATTNYIRDTRESRAVLDRLLFKCIVHRAESTLERFRIRREFITAHGHTVGPPEGGPIPYSDLCGLSRIIHGEVPEQAIQVPAHVLVMLDHVISAYEHEVNQNRTGDRFVFSDRSKNKAIHVLMASALRAGRRAAEVRDFAALHYFIPTVGNDEEEQIFDRVVQVAQRSFGNREREAIDQAAAIVDVVTEAIERKLRGTLEEPHWPERVRSKLERWMHRETAPTLGTLLEDARGLPADHDFTRKLKDEVLAAIRAAHEVHKIPYEQAM